MNYFKALSSTLAFAYLVALWLFVFNPIDKNLDRIERELIRLEAEYLAQSECASL